MATEYRIVRIFDMKRDGMSGSDKVTLGDVPEEYARTLLRDHGHFAKTVKLEEREVTEWRASGPDSDKPRNHAEAGTQDGS